MPNWKPIGKDKTDEQTNQQKDVRKDGELSSGAPDTNLNLKSENETTHRPKSNAINGNRQFHEGWLQIFPWLRYDKLKRTMSCINCAEANAPTNWREGISVMKKDCCVRHAGSNSHLKSLNICKLKGCMARPKSLSTAGLQKEGVIAAVQNVYWLVKENIAIHKSASLHNHVNTILKQYGKGIESSYTTDTCAWKIVDAISEVLELKIISKIKEAKYFSLCADESANIATSKSMVIYCRFAELPQYEVATYFFKLLEIKDGAAHSVYDEIINYLNKCKIDLKSFVGWASDGSSVMMGHRNGVENKLKEMSPCLISIHNPGHGENLAIADSYESVMYLKYTVDETLRDIYTYFCRSPNREEELKMLQDILEEPQLQMRKLYDIKWLARIDYMDAVRKLLKSLMECFREDTTDPLALAIYKQLTSYKFLLVFHAMCDIINNLAVLSKFLQKRDLHPYDIFPVVNSTINNIENNFASEECNSLLGGIHVSALHKYFKDSDYPLHFNQCLINYINFGEGDENQAISIIKTFSKNLVNNLKLRFYDIKNFDNWKIFDPKQIPSDQQILVQHGMKELKQLCNFYCHPETGVFDWKFADVQGEYQIFKEFVQKEAKNLYLIELCKLIILRYSKAFPLITQLMKLCLALPVGSADYKRDFSQRNPIKTTSVIGLEKEHLDALSRIRLNGSPSEKFDFEEAAVMLQKKMDPAKESDEVFDNTPQGIFEMSIMPPPDRNDAQKNKRLKKKKPNQRRPSSCSDSSSSCTDEECSDDSIPSSNNESQRKLTKQLKAMFRKSKDSQMKKMKNLIGQQEKIISQQQQILSCQSVHEEEIKELKFGNKRAIPSEQSISADFANKELTQTNNISENEDLIFKVASLIRTIVPNEKKTQNQSSTTIHSFQPPAVVRKICNHCKIDLTHTSRGFQTQHSILCLNTPTKSPSQALKSCPKAAKMVSGLKKSCYDSPERPPVRKAAKRQRELLSSVINSTEGDEQESAKIGRFSRTKYKFF